VCGGATVGGTPARSRDRHQAHLEPIVDATCATRGGHDFHRRGEWVSESTATRMAPSSPMSVTLRPMAENDFPHVVTWLSEPQVRQWWYQPLDLPAVRAKYLPRLAGIEPTHMMVIEDDGAPVGLAQWYRWDDYPDDRDNYRLGRDELGMDYAIGVPSARGRGVGRAAIEGVLGTMREAHAAGTAVSVIRLRAVSWKRTVSRWWHAYSQGGCRGALPRV
jgi:GNAT superfamily N-acetyltransferase